MSENPLSARDTLRVQHSVAELLWQRVYGLALGYEDLNVHDRLRHDPLLGAVSGKADKQKLLAVKSTLNRLELSTEEATRDNTKRYPATPRPSTVC